MDLQVLVFLLFLKNKVKARLVAKNRKSKKSYRYTISKINKMIKTSLSTASEKYWGSWKVRKTCLPMISINKSRSPSLTVKPFKARKNCRQLKKTQLKRRLKKSLKIKTSNIRRKRKKVTVPRNLSLGMSYLKIFISR